MARPWEEGRPLAVRRVLVFPSLPAALRLREGLLRSCVVGGAFFLRLEAAVVEGLWAALCALAIAGDSASPKAITMIHIEPNLFIRWSTQVNSKSLKPIVLPHISHQGNH